MLALSGAIHRIKKAGPSVRDDPHFIPVPPFSALGASPATTLRNGGCCSGLTRLNIVCLHSLAYKAWQITLYHSTGTARHCLLEVSFAGRNMLVDPTYGFYYVDEFGRGLGLSELRAGQCPSFASLPGSKDTSYPQNEYYQFDYTNTKTANWTINCIRKALYGILACITRGRIDTLRQPPYLEWPQLILISAISGVTLILDVILLFVL